MLDNDSITWATSMHNYFCEGGNWGTKPEVINFRFQAPVVQTLDSAIHRINHYPADKYYGNQLRYPLDRDLSDG